MRILKFVYLGICFLVYSSLFISSISISSANSIHEHYTYAHSDFNVSYIEEHINDSSTIITMTPLKNWYIINHEIRIRVDGNLIEFIPVDNNYSLPYRFQFSNDTINLLEKISKINISPVLNYLTESKLNETQNDFYSYYPENSTYDVIKISDEWHLISRSSIKNHSLFEIPINWPLFFIIILILLIVIYLIFEKYKRK